MATKNTWANRAVPERSARWLSQVEEHILRLVFLYLTLHGLDTACFSILKCPTDFTCYVTCRRFTFSATPIPPPAPRRIKWRHFHVRFKKKNYFLTLLSHDTLHFQSSSFTCTACVFIFQLLPRDLFAACALFCPPPSPPRMIHLSSSQMSFSTYSRFAHDATRWTVLSDPDMFERAFSGMSGVKTV